MFGPSDDGAGRSRRRLRQGRDRARLRDGLLRGLARKARRARDGRRHHAGAARDGSADERGNGDRDRVDRGERGGRAASRTSRSTSRSPNTARRSGATRTSGSRRRRGCSGRAASSSSSATRRSAILLLADDAGRKGRRAARAAAVRHASVRLGGRGRGRRLPSLARRDAAALARTGFEVEGLWEIQASESAEDHALLRLRLGRVGAQVAGRGDLEGPQARVSAPPAPPIILASVSPQRRAILEQLDIPFVVVPPRVRRASATIRSSSCANAREGALRRGRRAVPGARRRHGGRRRRRGARQAGGRRPKPRRCSSACRGARTKSSPASASDRAALGGAAAARRRGSRSAADGARSGALRRQRRVAGPRGRVCDPGSRRLARRALEGDYLNVVGLPAALLVRLLAERFPGTYGFG